MAADEHLSQKRHISITDDTQGAFGSLGAAAIAETHNVELRIQNLEFV